MKILSRALATCGIAVSAVAMCSPVAHAQQTHVLIVSGLSGAPAYKTSFGLIVAAVKEAAHNKWGVNDSSLIVLTETTEPSAASQGPSTKAGIANAFTRLSTRVKPGDQLLVLLIGHGSGEGAGSKVNLPGPDATAADYNLWLSGFSRQSVVFVNAATGSGDFLPVLKAPGRVIVTATRSAVEKNESIFAMHFAKALAGEDADADKDKRISVLEAFQYATREVAKVYDGSGRMQTEHAQISDSTKAMTVSFGKTVVNSDPRVAALLAERQALESAVAVLRAKKGSMDAAEYDKELERLLLAIAEKSQAIRAAGSPPGGRR